MLMAPSNTYDRTPKNHKIKKMMPLWLIIFLFFFSTPPGLTEGAPIKIAAIFSFTGAAAGSNAPSIKGIRVAVRTINQRGGVLKRPIELVEIDNQSSPIGSRVAAEKAARLGVTAIIGCNWSSHSLAVAKVAQKEGIPMISNISTHPDVTRTGDYIFRACFTDVIQSRAMAHFAKKTLNARTGVLMVDLNSNYGTMLSELFKKNFEKSGGRILSRLEYKNNSDQSHFRHMIARAGELNPDVIFIPGFVESGIILREMIKAGLNTIPLGGDGWGFNDFFKAGGSELKKGYYCTHWNPQSASAPLLEYLSHRQDKTNVWAAEILAVDAVNLLAHAISLSGSPTDRVNIRKHLSEIHGFQGITGTISFDKNGDPIKDVVIMEIRNGKPIFHSRFTLDTDEAKR
ncbi:ABC transporter substrate-binding protein [Desulfocicer niacini]